MTDLIASRQRQRAKIAAETRAFRNKFIAGLGGTCERNWVNAILREKLERQRPPLKPTLANLLEEARSYLASSKTEPSIPTSEYYSYCGLEDAAYERRREWREYAGELYRSYLALGGAADAELEACE